MKKHRLRISYNAPVALSFTIICLVVLILNTVTGGISNGLLFCVYRSSLRDPLTYFRLIGHVFGHGSLSHFTGNMMTFLILAPLLEEKYGSKNLALTILATALVTGIVHCLISSSALLGASGVVFALILLSSFTDIREGEIPLTLILVALLYIGSQIISGITTQDNVSNLTHILGGAVGAVVGFLLNSGRNRS